VLGQATGDLGFTWSPQPGLKGSHHLPPYSILCVCLQHLHPNGTFSQDFQGVPKLFRFGFSRFWKLITPNSDLQLGWGLKQIYSSLQDLFNNMSHSTYTHQDRVDSWLLVFRSQTTSLTPDPSFDHNLCCRCLNGSCKVIFNITFQDFPTV
jgi:hypothetical protein